MDVKTSLTPSAMRKSERDFRPRMAMSNISESTVGASMGPDLIVGEG